MKAIIFTEGQTDWKHIKKAYQKLNLNLDIEFWEDTNDRGDSNMYTMCVERSKAPNETLNIFIFDRDNDEINKKVNTVENKFKNWGNNVFSFSIPAPKSIRNYRTNISIEFYYKDDTITLLDKDKKRLYLSSEFDEKSGRHKTDPIISFGNKNKLKNCTSLNNAKVIDSDVFNNEGNNLALSKTKFADHIYNDEEPFHNIDFSEFMLIFDVICEIFASTDPDSKAIPIEIVKKTIIDHPPVNDVFVGREEIIGRLTNSEIRVAAITGIGGEGKSSLAARIYKLIANNEFPIRCEKVAWVDCKDEEVTFHEKLLGIIEFLTDGSESRLKYADENVKDTIKRFITILNSKNLFIVFDNVDAFVDNEKPCFVGNVKTLFDGLTNHLEKSYIIFTCRSKIEDHHFSFLEIQLQGLNFDEACKLALKFGFELTDNKKDIIENIHLKTKGHALWLNLIFGQLRNNRLTIEQINNIISKQTVKLDLPLLSSIWNSLKTNEKEIIVIISSFTRPPNKNKIERVSSLSYQKISKVLATLTNLRLVVELDKQGDTYYDLHPIIRVKATESVPSAKRKTLFVTIINTFGDLTKLSQILNLVEDYNPSIEDYIECVEISIEYKEYKEALRYLFRLSSTMLRFGQDVKFVELCENTFKKIDLYDEKIKNSREFISVYNDYMITLLNLGEIKKVEQILFNYSKKLVSINDLFHYSEWMSHFLWFQNEFLQAINFINEMTQKIIDKGQNVPSDVYYILALANRDNGNPSEALSFFLEKASKEKIDTWDPLAKEAEEISADVGNISRCYYLMGEYELSLYYCQKANQYLLRGKSRHSKVNYGYSLLWLADTYVKLNDIDNARLNIAKAVEIWTKYCPSRLTKIEKHIENYPDNLKNSIKLK